MKFASTILALAAAAGTASAHATVMAIFVNDVDQGLGDSAAGYIRSPPNNSPVLDVTSSAMTCNVNNAPTAKTIQVKSGDTVTFEWHHNTRDAADDIIDGSHKGPVLTYIAPTSSNGEGDVWVKLAEKGLEAGTWAVTQLIADRGKHSITIPDLTAGEYLLRPEIIAHHESGRVGGAQFYMECVQIEVTSDGSTSLPAGVAIPGAYSATEPGILVDIYNGISSYTIPGPAVWDGASGGGDAPAPAPPASSAPAPPASSAPAPPASSAPAPPASSAPAPPAPSAPAPSAPAPSAPAPTTLITAVQPAPTAAPPTGGSVAIYHQCGGANHTGGTACVSGTVCKVQNPYYSQCLSA